MKAEYKVLGLDNVLLGECPMWDAEQKKVRYLDILGRKSILLNLESGECTYTELNEDTGALAICADGVNLYAATSGIFDEYNNLICPFPEGRGLRFNDGKASPDGRFFVGSIEKGGGGALFCLSNGKLSAVIEGVKISNGLDWSLDLKTFYFCDTATRKIVAYSYPELKPLKTVIDFNEIEGFEGNPDGLCIDLDGNLWVAIWGGGCVVKVNAENGKILEKTHLPAKFISCPAFVGEELDTLFVTSAENGDESSLAGKCFALKTGAKGRGPFLVKAEHKNK
ncbi:MAG: SMP-30/gluconolactonase/LRE family protein [Ruminococcaceae bacterium]|nr:SMP-30/gluconolactonase/LRE family protein [Oscillospiraceae bacterium]